MASLREFVGKQWFTYLLIEPTISFQLRIRHSDRINDGKKQLRASIVFANLKPGQARILSGRKWVWGRSVYVSALRLDNGELLITVWVAESESMVVGWIEVKGAKVNGLYVDSSVSRSGVGSSLMAYAELTIQTQGKVVVHLDASPNAVSFYARLGYEVAGAPKPDNSVPMVKRFGHDT